MRAPAGPHVRLRRLLEATAPSASTTRTSSASGSMGCSMERTQPSSVGGSPHTRMSPPRFTSAPRAPWRLSSSTVRSAARPLPTPPASSAQPLGTVSVFPFDVDGESTHGAIRPRPWRDVLSDVDERPVVAQRDQVAAEERVEGSAGLVLSAECGGGQRDRVRVDANLAAGGAVHPRDVAVDEEPAPSPLEVFNALLRSPRQRRVSHHQHLGPAAHGREPAVSSWRHCTRGGPAVPGAPAPSCHLSRHRVEHPDQIGARNGRPGIRGRGHAG